MKRIEIDTATWIVRLIRDARCNNGAYIEPPVYRRLSRPKGTWLQKRMAELARKEAKQ